VIHETAVAEHEPQNSTDPSWITEASRRKFLEPGRLMSV
jgi:hypothetical protein